MQGNNGVVDFPANANISGFLTVGASDRYDQQSDYSPTSSLIDIVAPSNKARKEDISSENSEMWTIDIPDYPGLNPKKFPSIYTPLEYLPNIGTNHLAYTGRFGGTSFSCAVVAGVAALVLSVSPNLTPMQVYNVICNSADKVGNYTYTNGKSNNMGYGRVNAHQAVRYAINNYCLSTNITGIQTTRKVYCKNITMQNATIPSGVTLELIATEKTIINSGVTVKAGGTLILDGNVSINTGFKVESGTTFTIK